MCQKLRRKNEGSYKFKNKKDMVPAFKAFIIMRRDKNKLKY